jgi:hypothetical protein
MMMMMMMMTMERDYRNWITETERKGKRKKT